MIERNLGNVERLVRFTLGCLFALWTASQPYMSMTDWFVAIVALFLILNGIFSRCYLWYIIDQGTNARCRA
jgi:hypothetical protein